MFRMLLILRHGPNKWINKFDIIHHIKIRIKMVLGVQGRQVCDGGRRTGTRRSLERPRGCSRGRFQVTCIRRGQSNVLQICREGPSVASMASSWTRGRGGLIVAPWWTHFLLMTSILLLLLLVQAESESCVLFGGPIGYFGWRTFTRRIFSHWLLPARIFAYRPFTHGF